jgi:hypothetical protein
MAGTLVMAVLVLDLETALFNPTHARCLTGVHPAVLGSSNNNNSSKRAVPALRQDLRGVLGLVSQVDFLITWEGGE